MSSEANKYMNLDLNEESLSVYEALASPVRLHVLRLLSERPMNVKELATTVGLSSAIMTMHVRKLSESGLISTQMLPGKSGLQKVCSLAVSAAEIHFPKAEPTERKCYRVEIPVGHYSDFYIEPTCGLATTDKFIGSLDDPRYFWEPERINASIVWFGQGFIEYKAPNYLLAGQVPTELVLTMEIASEAPGINNNYPSDISFTFNGTRLGVWTSPGDYGDQRGKFTPEWWPRGINQYGLLKQLRITPEGTFMDGLKLSDVSLENIDINRKQWTFRLAVEKDAARPGGLTLFGKGFGNYNEHLILEQFYREREQPL
jgi:predicted transcriptional regulator